MYQKGLGVEKNLTIALEYFNKSMIIQEMPSFTSNIFLKIVLLKEALENKTYFEAAIIIFDELAGI